MRVSKGAVAALSPNRKRGSPSSPVSLAVSKVTPDNKKQKKALSVASFNGHTHFSFRLKNGEDEYKEGVREAVLFFKEYEDMILFVKKFKTHGGYATYLKKRVAEKNALQPLAVVATSTVTASDADREIAKKLAALTAGSEPCDALVAHVKVTSHSTQAALLIEFRNLFDSHYWGWKPNLQVPTLNKYPEVVAIADPLLKEFLCNLTHAYASDPNSSDKSKRLVTIFEPKNDIGRKISIDEYRAFSYITIPHASLSSREEEEAWLSTNVQRLMEGLRDVMNTSVFELALRSNRFKKSFIDKLYEPGKKTNLPDFLSHARGIARPCVHLTDHVIQPEADLITQHLYAHRLKDIKYPLTKEDLADITGIHGNGNEDVGAVKPHKQQGVTGPADPSASDDSDDDEAFQDTSEGSKTAADANVEIVD